MTAPPSFDDLSPSIRSALEGRGFTALTPVQEAVLDPALAGRDLRIFSQTGSGKTVAVGLAIAPDLERVVAAPPPPREGTGKLPPVRPFALVVAPTRELAAQIGGELSWLFAPIKVGVTVVTGGASYPKELAALRKGPLVIAGTPGRLLDHLERKSIDPSGLGVVVLDEADQMLDLGFRDELEAILDKTPAGRRTLLLSATFPREVQRLADRCQKDPIVAAGAGAGERNVDINHVAHIVLSEERDRALVNILLMAPGERALVFVRTRDGASELADNLSNRGLPARAIHGDMEQRDRTRTLDAFRSGAVTTLVATDVAARGLDVPDVFRVIHADPPNDAEVFTHRSGRTGRAGKKGTSIVFVPPGLRERARSMLRRAGVEAVWSAAPTAADVLRAADERLAAELASPPEGAPAPAPRLRALAEQLLATMEPLDLVAALLARTDHAGPCPPADVTALLPPARGDRAPHTVPPPRGRDGAYPNSRGSERGSDRGSDRASDRDGPSAAHDDSAAPGYVPFRINWGERHGADARRLLAMVCRRGGIRGSDVGAIRIGTNGSTFQVAAAVAEGFAGLAKKPDTRDPKIRIESVVANGGPGPQAGPHAPAGHAAAGHPPAGHAPAAASAPADPAPGPAPAEAAPPPPPVRRKIREERAPVRGHASRTVITAGPPTPRSPVATPPAPAPEAAAELRPVPASGQAPPKRRPRWAE